MRSPIFWWHAVKSFVVTYPAVLSGYVIYSYLFLCIIRFFLLARLGEASMMRAYETFVAVPFLWLLALSLVKVIDIRTRWHESETRRLQDQQELVISKLQLTTLQEVVRGVQHQVNNPLGVMLFAVERIKRSEAGNPVVFPLAQEIEVSIRRVTSALTGFTMLESYQIASAGCGVGNLAVPEPMPEPAATRPLAGSGVDAMTTANTNADKWELHSDPIMCAVNLPVERVIPCKKRGTEWWSVGGMESVSRQPKCGGSEASDVSGL